MSEKTSESVSKRVNGSEDPEQLAVDVAPDLDPEVRSRATAAMAKYALARLGLFLGLTALIVILARLIGSPVPIVISALLALIVAFPLSMLILPRLRLEANEAFAAWDKQRKDRKEWVRRELQSR